MPVLDQYFANGIVLLPAERVDAHETGNFSLSIECGEFAGKPQAHNPALSHKIEQFGYCQHTGNGPATAMLQLGKRLIGAQQAILCIGQAARGKHCIALCHIYCPDPNAEPSSNARA